MIQVKKEYLTRKMEEARGAKKEHKESADCEEDGCTACHYWSGVISTYSSLLGEYGVID